jgi:excinuclease ABC subunit A
MVIEHNLDLVKCADYIIDIGPEGGKNGGEIVAKGTPEQIADNPKSYTGKYLKKILDR